MTPRLAFFGIGLMGRPMSARLLAADFPLMVWNRSPAKCAALAPLGARIASSVAEAVADADVLMLCLADTAAVDAVVFGPDGIAAHGHPGQLLVDFSSIAPAATRDFAARLQQACGMHWVDAPVSGGVAGAEAGSLVVMAGGEEADIDRLRPLLAPLAQRVTRMGPVGAGQVSKVCNQLIVAANSLLIAEAVALAQNAGVDAALLAPALAGGFADSKPFQILAPRMSTHTFEPVQWKVATLLKDLDTAVQLAQQAHCSAPMAELAERLMRLHADGGNAAHDLSSVIQLYTED